MTTDDNNVVIRAGFGACLTGKTDTGNIAADLGHVKQFPNMKGLMQDYPLVVNSILDYAAKFHSEQEVITCTVEGSVHRYTYADMHKRSQLCSLALHNLGVRYGFFGKIRLLPVRCCACITLFVK